MTDDINNYYQGYDYGSRVPIKADINDLTDQQKHLLMESDVFCILPWIHLHAFPDGRAYPCCLADADHPVGSMHTHTMEEIFHDSHLKNIRAKMVAGSKCVECKKCYEQEEAGFFSMRNSSNKAFGHNITDIEIHEDGTADEFKLRYYDIRFSNLCNLSCRTCGDIFSSNWVKESKRMQWLPKDAPNISYAGRHQMDAWEQLIPHIPYIEQVYFAGGEPLIMEEHYRLLKELLRQGRTDVKLVYNTNFTNISYKQENVFNLWNRFDCVSVGASLDAMEERGEYMRYPCNWNEIERNRQRMIEDCPTVDFYVSSTLSIMNAYHLPDFHRDWVERGLIRPMDWNINILQGPDIYRIDVLPQHHKEKIKAKYEEHIEWLKPRDEFSRAIKGYMGAVNFMMAQDNSHLLPQFLHRTGILDGARHERFFSVFPELGDLIDLS